jgi:rubrerythrin
LHTVFVEENGKDTSRIRIGLSELDAVKDAMLMEDKSYDLYQQRRKQAEDGDQRSFYEKLLNEEREHKMVLLNYYEYMKDPVSWCVKAERQSFDG